MASSTRTNLLQDVNYKSGMEVLHEGHSTLNILVVKSDGSSSKSELVIHKPVISSLLYNLRQFKQSAVSTFYNGGFHYILSPPNLQVKGVNNLENINLEDTVLTPDPVTAVIGSDKESNKLKLGGDVIHTISGLTMQKSDPSGVLIFEKLKYKDSHCHLHDIPEFSVFHNYTSLMCYKHKTMEGKGFTLLLHWDIQTSLHFAWEIQSLLLLSLGYTKPNPNLPGNKPYSYFALQKGKAHFGTAYSNFA